MHYVIHVFTEPGGSIEDAMEPFRERYESDADDADFVGEWDYWLIGGRWDGYFEGKNAVTATEALEVKGLFDSPYAYLTLDGKWLPKETYIPEGFPDPTDEHPDRKSHFRDVDGFVEDYRAYLAAVPVDTVVTTVDIHS